MRTAYPVIFIPQSDGGYVAYIPDFDMWTQGSDIADAIYMARDAISLMSFDKSESGKEVPKPSAPLSVTCVDGEFVSMVDVDFDVCDFMPEPDAAGYTARTRA
jgi:predicted RNase H-like HicB family nuclease